MTTPASPPLSTQRTIRCQSNVLQEIRCHARSSMQTEICGVLIGHSAENETVIDNCIRGEGAVQGGAHVTFTQDTWEHIFQVKDKQYAEKTIVGWYHSHPGFGVFLSEHDTFIHKNFFSAPSQVAWVFDPHSDEEGCFGWKDGEVVPVESIMLDRSSSKDARARTESLPTPDTGADSLQPPGKKTRKDYFSLVLPVSLTVEGLFFVYLLINTYKHAADKSGVALAMLLGLVLGLLAWVIPLAWRIGGTDRKCLEVSAELRSRKQDSVAPHGKQYKGGTQ